MQDYPRSLPENAAVGFTVVSQVWAAYSPVKNGASAAAAKAALGEPTHSAAAAEFDLYKSACRALQLAGGCALPDGDAPGARRDRFGGVPVEGDWPRVALSPAFAPTLGELARRLGRLGPREPGPEPPIRLAARSVLVLDGAGIEVRGPVDVDGALVVRAAPGCHVVVGALRVRNRGWAWRAIGEGGEGGGGGAREEDAMRGFVVDRLETEEYVFERPGEYHVGGGEEGQEVRRRVEGSALVPA